MRQAAQIAGQTSTRRLGDYRVKLNYTDIDLLRYRLSTRAHTHAGLCPPLAAFISASPVAPVSERLLLRSHMVLPHFGESGDLTGHPAAVLSCAGCICFPRSDLFLAARLEKIEYSERWIGSRVHSYDSVPHRFAPEALSGTQPQIIVRLYTCC